MNGDVKVVCIDAGNVAQHGFFCYKSKRKSEGYRRKLHWLEQRFSEGMKIRIVYESGRCIGFIEYIPGEFAWRAVHAQDYMVIHCHGLLAGPRGKGTVHVC